MVVVGRTNSALSGGGGGEPMYSQGGGDGQIQ